MTEKSKNRPLSDLSSPELAEVIERSRPGSEISRQAMDLLVDRNRKLIDQLISLVDQFSSEERKRHVNTLVAVLSSADPSSELFMNSLQELAIMAKGEDVKAQNR